MGFIEKAYLGGIVTVCSGVLLCGDLATPFLAQTKMVSEKRGTQVRVLVWNHAQAPRSVVKRAGSEAVRIFREAGIELKWVNCSGGGTAAECRVISDSKQLVLQIVPGGKTSSDLVCGVAFLGEDGRGKYADIFYPRIIERARREDGIDAADLLGAVAAHEIGHLLLGSHAHSWTGIMASLWRKESLRELKMGSLFFTREQGAHMRQWTRREPVTVASVGAKAED